jgi:hypothetical protein
VFLPTVKVELSAKLAKEPVIGVAAVLLIAVKIVPSASLVFGFPLKY